MAEEAETIVFEIVEQEVESSEAQNQTDHSNEAVQLLVQAYEYGNQQGQGDADSDSVHLLVQGIEQQEGQIVSVDLQSGGFSMDGVQLLVQASEQNQEASVSDSNVGNVDGINMLADVSGVEQKVLTANRPQPDMVGDNYHNTFMCQICSKTFISNTALQKHYKSHRNEGIATPKSEVGFTCELCEVSYLSKRALQYHRLKAHSDVLQIETSEGQKKSIIGQMIQDEEEQGVHVDKLYSVPLTEKPVENLTTEEEAKKQDEELRIEQMVAQARKDGFVLRCGECDRVYPSKWSLKRHMFLVHSDKKEEELEAESNNECSLCGAAFLEKETLGHHMKQVHEKDLIKQAAEQAKLIDKVDDDQDLQVEPPTEDAEGDEAPMDEEIAETSDKEWLPDGGTSDKEWLPDGVTSNKEWLPDGGMSDKEWIPDGGIKHKFACGLCDKSYPQKATLKKHMISIHIEERPRGKSVNDERPRTIICGVCDKKYLTRDNMRRHMKQTHWLKTPGEVSDDDDQDLELDESQMSAAEKDLLQDAELQMDDVEAEPKEESVLQHESNPEAETRPEKEPQPGTSASYEEEQPMEDEDTETSSDKETYLSSHGLKRQRPGSEDEEPNSKKTKMSVQSYLKVSPVVGDLACSPCGKMFAHKYSLSRHLESPLHKKTLKDIQAGEGEMGKTVESIETGDEDDVKAKIDAESLFCHPCGNTYARKDTFARHLVSPLHKSTLRELKKSKDKTDEVVEDDDNIETDDRADEQANIDAEDLICQPCGKTFARKDALARHLASLLHKSTLKELQEGKDQTDEIVEIDEQAKIDVENLICSPCGKTFGRKDALARHLESPMHKNAAEKLFCVPCDKSFARRDLLEKHLKSSIHKEVVEGSADKSGSPAEEVEKLETPERSVVYDETQFIEVETGGFECIDCRTQVAQKHNLQRHLDTKYHKNVVEKSESPAEEVEKLETPERSVVYDETQFMEVETGGFECIDCGTQVAQKHNLQRHLDTKYHKNVVENLKSANEESFIQNEKGEYECLLCDKVYNESAGLQKHMDTRFHKDKVDALAKKQIKDSGLDHKQADELVCAVCDETFSSNSALDKHLKSSQHNDNVKAKELADAFMKTKAGDYKCKVCQTTVTQHKHLKRHLESQMHKNKADSEDKTESTPSKLIKPNADGEFECILCETAYPNRNRLKNHYESKRHHDAVLQAAQTPAKKTPKPKTPSRKLGAKGSKKIEFKCQPCGKLFAFKYTYEQHLDTQAHKNAFRDSKAHKNAIRAEVEKSLKPPTVHLAYEGIPVGQFVCEPCGTSFSSSELLKEHFQSKLHKGKFAAAKKPLVKIPVQVQVHEVAQEKAAKMVTEMFVCKPCGSEYPSQKSLEQHLGSSAHKNKMAEKGNDPDDTIEEELCEFACFVCGNVYPDKQLLDTHLLSHEDDEVETMQTDDIESDMNESSEDVRGIEVYPCEKCDRYFQGKSLLKRHMQYLHAEGEEAVAKRPIPKDFGNFKCDICDRVYRYQRGLKEHQQRIHLIDEAPEGQTLEDIDDLTCNKCNKTFPFKFSLEKHMERAHANEPNKEAKTKPEVPLLQFACDLCTKRFSSRVGLTRHQLQSHPAKTGKKLADIAPDQGKKESEIKGEFPCDECDRVYSYERGLKRHKQMCHDEAELMSDASPKAKNFNLPMTSTPVVSSVGLDSFTKVGENRYPCGVCDKVLLSRTTWKRHRSSHGPEELEKFVMTAHIVEDPMPESDKNKNMEISDSAENLQKQTGGGKDQKSKSNETEKELYYCDPCNKYFPRKYSLMRHIETDSHQVAAEEYAQKPLEKDSQDSPKPDVLGPEMTKQENQEEEVTKEVVIAGNQSDENVYILCQGEGENQNFLILQRACEADTESGENVMMITDESQEPTASGSQGIRKAVRKIAQTKGQAGETVTATEAITQELGLEIIEMARDGGEQPMITESLILEMAPDVDLSQLHELRIEIVPENLTVDSSNKGKTNKQGGSYKCNICSKYYPWKWSLKRHMLQSHYVKLTEEDLKKYLVKDGDNNEEEGEDPLDFKCDQCDASYAYEHNLTTHKRSKHHNRQGNVTEAEKAVEEIPMETEEIVMEAQEQDVMQQLEQDPQSTTEATYHCSACGQISMSQVEHDKHLCLQMRLQELQKRKSPVKITRLAKKSTSSSADTTVLCDFCAEIFPTAKEWQKHECSEQTEESAVRTLITAEEYVSEEVELAEFDGEIADDLERLLQMAEGGFKEDSSLATVKIEPVTVDEVQYVRDSKEKIPFLYPCADCDRWYPTEQSLEEHLKTTHASKSATPEAVSRGRRQDKSGKFVCEVCGNKYRYKRGLVEHVKEHYCEFDKFIIEDQRKLSRMKAPSEYLCDVCGIVSVSKDSLRHHLRTHEQEIVEKKQYLCEVCGLNCQNKREKKAHLKTHKLENVIWSCDQCPKTFPSNRGLLIQTHVSSHTGEKPFECHICGKKLLRKCHLNTHLKKHEAEKTIYVYECGECGKRFRQRSHLKVHIMSHNGEKPHECTDCGKRFLMHSHMKYHQKTVHAIVKPANFTCDKCGQLFVHKHHYKTHMMRHSGEKPYECDRCGKRFIQRSHLKTHIMTHTGEKPHECDHCGKRFLMSSHLKTHLISTHSTSTKIFQCGVCNKKCPTHHQFKAHMKIHAPTTAAARKYELGKNINQLQVRQQYSNPLEVLSSIIVDSNNEIVPMSESNSHVEVEVLNSIHNIPGQGSQVERQVEITSSAATVSSHGQLVEVESSESNGVSVYHPGSGSKIDPSSCILIIPESSSQPKQQSRFRILPEMNTEDQPTSAILISHNVPRSSVTLEPSTMRGAYIISESDYDGEIDASSGIRIAGGDPNTLRIVEEAVQEQTTVEVVPEIQMGEDNSEQTTTIYVDEEGNPIDPATTIGYYPVQEGGRYLASASQLESGSAINVVLENDPIDERVGEMTTLEAGQTVVYVTEPETDIKSTPPTVVTCDYQTEEKAVVYMEESGENAGATTENVAHIVYVPEATPKTEPYDGPDQGAELEAAQAIIYVSESCTQADQQMVFGVGSELGTAVKAEVDAEDSGEAMEVDQA